MVLHGCVTRGAEYYTVDHQVCDVTVLLQHGGNCQPSLGAQAIVTKVQFSHCSIRLAKERVCGV